MHFSSLFVAYDRVFIIHHQSPSGPVNPSFRALSRRLKFMVRRHKFIEDSLSFCRKRWRDGQHFSFLLRSRGRRSQTVGADCLALCHPRDYPPSAGSDGEMDSIPARRADHNRAPHQRLFRPTGQVHPVFHRQWDVNYREILRATVWSYEFHRRIDGRVPPAEGTRPYEKLTIPTDLAIVHITLLVGWWKVGEQGIPCWA